MSNKRTVYPSSQNRGTKTRNEMRRLYQEQYGGRSAAFREAVTPMWLQKHTQAEIDAEILKREALWIQQAAPEQVNALSRMVVGNQKRLSKRVSKPRFAGHPRYRPSDEDVRSSKHKRRPTIRRIKGSNWRLAGTAHAANTYAEQLAISQTLAKSIRQVGAKARVIKWKDQVGVYFQPRSDPIEKIWGNSSIGRDLKTDKPASYIWEPAVYGRFKPHMMYNPKTGEGVFAQKEEDHIRMSKQGWVHKSASNTAYQRDMSVDCSGMNCPYPVLYAKNALAEMEPGDTLTLVATDWEAEYDVPMLASRYGHNLQSINKNEATGEITFTITKGDRAYDRKMPTPEEVFSPGAIDFPNARRPMNAQRKLLVLREPGEMAQYQQYGMTNGISMGWVTRAEAAQLLAERGIYPSNSEFDRAFKDELAQNQTVSGLKQAEQRAKERELWADSLKVMREAKGSPDEALIRRDASLDDYSWSVLDLDGLADGTKKAGSQLYCLYDKVSAIGVGGVGPQLEGMDLYNAYREFLIEDGFSEDEIADFLRDTAEFELKDLFHCSDTAQELDENARKSIVDMQRITGYRDGKELGEWNEMKPLKTKLFLKDPREIDWSNEGTAKAARKILWNAEFGGFRELSDMKGSTAISLADVALERALDQYEKQRIGVGTTSGRSDQAPRPQASSEEARKANLKSKIDGRKFRSRTGLNITERSFEDNIFDEKKYNKVNLDFKDKIVRKEWNEQPIPSQYFGTNRIGWKNSRRGKEEMVRYLWYRNKNNLGPASTSEILQHLNSRYNGNYTANQISNFLGKDVRFEKKGYLETNDRGFRVREESWDLNYDLKVKQ